MQTSSLHIFHTIYCCFSSKAPNHLQLCNSLYMISFLTITLSAKQVAKSRKLAWILLSFRQQQSAAMPLQTLSERECHVEPVVSRGVACCCCQRDSQDGTIPGHANCRCLLLPRGSPRCWEGLGTLDRTLLFRGRQSTSLSFPYISGGNEQTAWGSEGLTVRVHAVLSRIWPCWLFSGIRCIKLFQKNMALQTVSLLFILPSTYFL